MKIKTLSGNSIFELQIPGLKHERGAMEAHANRLSSSKNPEPHSLVFVSNSSDLPKSIEKRASIIIALKKILISAPNLAEDQCLFSVQDISAAMVPILALFDDKTLRVPTGISSSARIHPSAQIGKNVTIGDFVSIAEAAVVEENVTLSPFVVIEKAACIGAGSYIHPHVVIGARCEVGKRCEVHSFTCLGSDGFGYTTDQSKKHLKIPQVGIVVIEDDVEIGANCAIDRATMTETRIGQGSKLDNFVHIAHNCSIGKNSRIAAGFMLAGSSSVGENFLVGGGTLVSDHVQITNNVTLAGNSAVTKDVEVPGAYAGYPLEPLKEAMKNIANIANLTKMRKQIHEIKMKLGLKDKN